MGSSHRLNLSPQLQVNAVLWDAAAVGPQRGPLHPASWVREEGSMKSLFPIYKHLLLGHSLKQAWAIVLEGYKRGQYFQSLVLVIINVTSFLKEFCFGQ